MQEIIYPPKVKYLFPEETQSIINLKINMDLNSNVFLQSFSQKIRPTACTCACPSNDGHKIKENISCPGEFPSLAEISEAYWPH